MEYTSETSLKEATSIRTFKSNFGTTFYDSVKWVFKSNIRTTKFWLPTIFLSVLFFILFFALFIGGLASGKNGSLDLVTQAAIFNNISLVSTIFYYSFLVIILTLISPFLFNKNNKANDNNELLIQEKYNHRSFWGMITGKYIGFVLLLLLYTVIVSTSFFVSASLFTMQAGETMYWLSHWFSMLFFGIIVITTWGVVVTACGIFFKHIWQATTFIVGLMFGILMLWPLQVILNVHPTTSDVVAIDQSQSDSNAGYSETVDYETITTSTFADYEGSPYKYIAYIDVFAGTVSLYDFASVSWGNSDLYDVNSPVILTTPKKVTVGDVYYNPENYEALYPSWTLANPDSPETGCGPSNSAIIYTDVNGNGVYDDGVDIQTKATFSANGWCTKYVADEFSTYSQLVSPYGNSQTGVDNTYLTTQQSYEVGLEWTNKYNSGMEKLNSGQYELNSSDEDIQFVKDTWLLGFITLMEWANTTYMENSNIVNSTGGLESEGYGQWTYADQDGDGDWDQPGYNIDGVRQTAGTAITTGGIDDPYNYYLDRSNSYESVGDMYLAYVSDDYNPFGAADEERFGAYTVSFSDGGSAPQPEMTNGIYLDFFQFAGSVSTWADFYKQPNLERDPITGDYTGIFYMDWLQSFVGADEAMKRKMSTYFDYSVTTLGDWNYFKSMSMYFLLNESLIQNVSIAKMAENKPDLYLILVELSNILPGEDGIYVDEVNKTLTMEVSTFYKVIGSLITGSYAYVDVTGPGNSDADLIMSQFDGYGFASALGTALHEYNNDPDVSDQEDYRAYITYILTQAATTTITYIDDDVIKSSYYSIPGTPTINAGETVSRLSATAQGSMGIFNQTYYSVEVDEYIPSWGWFLIFYVISIGIFFPISGFVVMHRNYS